MPLPKLHGHLDQRQVLENAFSSDTAHHAWIFSGPKGIGKHLCALHLARDLFIRQDQMPGLENKIQIQAYPDLLQVGRGLTDSGALKVNITVDEVRKVNAFTSQTTAMQEWRAIIVDEADLFNRAAANAILKVLEEPPPKTLLILITSAVGVLLPTIRSRCQVLNFRPLSRADFRTVLGGVGDSEVLYELSNGSPGRAQAFQESGALDLFLELQAAQSLATLSKTVRALAQIEDTEVTELLLNHWLHGRIREMALKNTVYDHIRPWFDLQQQVTLLLANKRQYTLDATHVMACIVFEIQKCMNESAVS